MLQPSCSYSASGSTLLRKEVMTRAASLQSISSLFDLPDVGNSNAIGEVFLEG